MYLHEHKSEIKGYSSGNWFRFRFVFVSCVRAGEAKLRERMRGTCLLNAGEENAQMSCGGGSGSGLLFFIFATIHKGFKEIRAHLLLHTHHGFKEKLRICCYTQWI